MIKRTWDQISADYLEVPDCDEQCWKFIRRGYHEKVSIPKPVLDSSYCTDCPSVTMESITEDELSITRECRSDASSLMDWECRSITSYSMDPMDHLLWIGPVPPMDHLLWTGSAPPIHHLWIGKASTKRKSQNGSNGYLFAIPQRQKS